MGEVKLLGGLTSPFSCRVEWALLHKGIEYVYIDEDVHNKSPLLLKCNPVHKKIPVLLHGERPIAESLIILEYIEETWKENPLLPQDPLGRAKARFWAKFAEEKCASNVRIALVSQGKEQEKALEEAFGALKVLDEEIKGKEFFGGESVGLVDLVVGTIPHWIPVIEAAVGFKLLDADEFPSFHAWGERFLNLPLIKDKLPPTDKMLTYFTKIRKSVLNN